MCSLEEGAMWHIRSNKNCGVVTAGHYLSAAINNRGMAFSVQSVLMVEHATAAMQQRNSVVYAVGAGAI
jgi:hypothetical protein